MSVLVYDNQMNKYLLLTKGADNTMSEIINFNNKEEEEKLNNTLDLFSKEGLRILVMGGKVIELDEFQLIKEEIDSCLQKGEGDSLFELYTEIERDLTLYGCSAIEDKLQEGVEHTISHILKCEMRLCMDSNWR